MVRRVKPLAEEVHLGSGNVFVDLGYPDAEERKTKLQLAFALNRTIAEANLTQIEIGQRLGLQQPKVSALVNYKLSGFSVERLFELLVAMGRDVTIVVADRPASRKARITVEA